MRLLRSTLLISKTTFYQPKGQCRASLGPSSTKIARMSTCTKANLATVGVPKKRSLLLVSLNDALLVASSGGHHYYKNFGLGNGMPIISPSGI